MGALNILAGIAAVVLGLELMVVTILAAAVCVGIWFGLRFVERKTNPLFDKANGYIRQGKDIEHKVLATAVKPVIMAHALGENIGVTLSTLVERSRR